MNGGFNMADMFGKIQEMQQRMAEAQQAAAAKTVTAEAGGGMVKVTANGARRILSIKIEKEAIDPSDPEVLEDLIVAGINKALEAAEEVHQSEMKGAAGMMMPPGLDLGQFGL